MALKEALESLAQQLERMVKDFATLTVSTFTVDTAGKSTLRAKTVVKLDGDTEMHVPTDGAAIAIELLTIHNDAVKNAIEARVKTVEAVVDAAKSIIK